MPRRAGYSSLQITLHWLVAILILAAWIWSDGAEDESRGKLLSGAGLLEGNTLHDWLGWAAFALIVLRMAVRTVQGAPGPVPGTSAMMESATVWGHRLLYLLMIAAPALGIVVWYGRSDAAGELHETFSNALMIVALGHAAAAIWHQLVKKDAVLTRMIRPGA